MSEHLKLGCPQFRPGCSSGIESFAGSHGYQNFEGALHRITAPLESVTDDYHSPSNIPGYSNALTAGDVNNDGRSDLIIGDPGSDRVYIYLK
ncbi:MAG: FG-GAP repeat protein [Candidatus Thiodiazotropha sp. 6PLUC1]